MTTKNTETYTAVRMRAWTSDGKPSAWVNPNRPALQMMAEVEFGHGAPFDTREAMWLTWHALGRPGDFDTWVETVEDLETTEKVLGKAS